MNSASVSSENKERILELLADFPNTQTAYALRKQSNSLEKLESLMTSENKKIFLLCDIQMDIQYSRGWEQN